MGCLTFLLTALPIAPAWPGYEEGYRAWKAHQFEEAFVELMPLAEQGHIGAQVIVGSLYENGKGVSEDQSVAVYWLTMAADAGDSLAQYWLASKYATGFGVAENVKEAVRLYELAAKQGDPDAQVALGNHYSEGQGVLQDFERAFSWFQRAAALGNGTGMHNLGVMLAKGEGTPRNYVEAHKWLNLASGIGEAYSAEARDALAQVMTPAHIAEAQRLAREWRPIAHDEKQTQPALDPHR